MNNTFAALMKIIGREELITDERTATREARATAECRKFCDEIIGGWARQKTSDEIIAVVSQAGIPCAKVSNVPEMIADEQVAHRQMVRKVEHVVAGDVYVSGPVVHFSAQKSEIYLAPPMLGEHNEQVYGEMGYTPEQIAALKEKGVI